MKRRAILTFGSVAMLTVLVAVVIFAARQAGPASRILDRANRLIESYPDSALNMLDSLDTSGARPQTQALHALLITQAMVKCGIPVPDDSLITTVLDHYGNHGPDSLLMRASFYQAQVRYDLGDITRAVAPAVCAHDLAVEADDPYWRAKSAELLAFISADAYYREMAIEYDSEAAKYYYDAGRIINHFYSLIDLGLSYTNNHNYEQAEVLFDSIYHESVVQKLPTDIISYLLSSQFVSAVYAKDFARARLIEVKIDSLGIKLSDTQQTIGDQISVELGENVDISPYQEAVRTGIPSYDDKVAVYTLLANYYRKKGDFKESLEFTDSLLSMQNQKVREIVKQSVVTASRDYYSNMANEERSKVARIKENITTFTIVTGVSLTFILYVIISRIRIRKREIKHKIEEIFSLNEEVGRYIKENQRLRRELDESERKQCESQPCVDNCAPKADGDFNSSNIDLFQKQWATINRLCYDYFERGSLTEAPAQLLSDLEKQIKSIYRPKGIALIEASLNLHVNDIIKRLRQQCPWISESDMHFITFVYAGFSPRAVSLFMNIQLKTFYNKKSRLSDRILKSECPDSAEFTYMLKSIK